MTFYLIKNKKEVAITPLKKIGSGATATIYSLQGTDDYVLKLYGKGTDKIDLKSGKKNFQKLEYFIKRFPSQELKPIDVLPDLKVNQLAWPTEIVFKNKKPVGFIMPNINHNYSIQLNRIFSINNRKKEGIKEDISWRINVARNLADVYASLHSKGFFVISGGVVNAKFIDAIPAQFIKA